MSHRTKLLAVCSSLMIAGIVSAGDTIRLGGKASDAAETRRLDLKPSDSEKDKTEKTCHFWGGYRSYYYGPSFSYFPSYSWGWPSYSYYSWPGYYPYYSWPSYSYYSWPSYSYYWAPRAYSYYYAPVYWSAPRVYYVEPSASMTQSRQAAPQSNESFRYDGDRSAPADRIPPARLEEPDPLPAPSPKLGPAPTETKISLPSTKRKLGYPAYGDDRKRDDKTILIRGR